MNPLFRIPIKLQLLLIVIIVALPAVGIIAYSGVQQRNQAIEDARKDTQRLVDRISSEQRILVASARQLLVSLPLLPEIREKDAAKVNLLLSEILKLNPNFSVILIADRTGSIWASALPLQKPVSVSDRRYFRNALETGQLSSGEYQVGRASSKTNLPLGYPYRNNRGEIIGVVSIGINLEYYKHLVERTQLPPRAGMVLIDHKGSILYRALEPENYIGKQANPALFKKMQEGPDAGTAIEAGIAGDPPGQKRYVSYQKLRLEGEQAPYMYVRVGIPVQSVLSPANTHLVRNLALFAFFLALALFLARFIGKTSIADRIALLEKTSRALADGDLRVRVSDLIKGGELGSLGESFDAMASTLDRRISEQQKTQEELALKQQQLEELNQSLEARIDAAVADSRRKDQILIQQSRLAAMGEMISNIAHQWRQPLNNIGLVVQNLGLAIQSGELREHEVREEIGKVMNILEFMSSTIDAFRNFFRMDKKKEIFSVNTAVGSVLEFIRASLENSSIKVDLIAEDGVVVTGYPNEYAQVLLNIFSNAREVLLERKVREPKIRISLCSLEGRSIVTISDNAGGISDDVLPRIFDPYFTTKGNATGTGIGLYMSKMIIEQNMRGMLTACNVDGGAEFRIEV